MSLEGGRQLPFENAAAAPMGEAPLNLCSGGDSNCLDRCMVVLCTQVNSGFSLFGQKWRGTTRCVEKRRSKCSNSL